MHEHDVSIEADANATFEELDMLAMKEFLIREKICENFMRNEEITSPAQPQQKPSNVSYWDKAVHIIELVWYHMRRYSNHENHAEETEMSSKQRKLYSNVKNIKALCRQGNPTVAFVFHVKRVR